MGEKLLLRLTRCEGTNLRTYSANYVVAINGDFYLVYGTSCSSPVSATIFSAINDARLAAGKGPIGFINPTVCASPHFYG